MDNYACMYIDMEISDDRPPRPGRKKIADRIMPGQKNRKDEMTFIFLSQHFSVDSPPAGLPRRAEFMPIPCCPSVLYKGYTPRSEKPCLSGRLSNVIKSDTHPIVKLCSLCVGQKGREMCAKLKFRQVRQLPPHRQGEGSEGQRSEVGN